MISEQWLEEGGVDRKVEDWKDSVKRAMRIPLEQHGSRLGFLSIK